MTTDVNNASGIDLEIPAALRRKPAPKPAADPLATAMAQAIAAQTPEAFDKANTEAMLEPLPSERAAPAQPEPAKPSKKIRNAAAGTSLKPRPALDAEKQAKLLADLAEARAEHERLKADKPKPTKPAKAKKPAKPAKKAPPARPAGEGPSGMVAEILKLASRKSGITPAELNELTSWQKAPWKWLFQNPKGTGFCDRWSYKLNVVKDDAGTHYHVTKI
jgi:hypothetical protein